MGEENLAPHKYEGYRVGPLSATVALPEGVDPEDAVKEVLDLLKPAYDLMFLAQRDKYHEHHAMKG